ncbi:porin [Polaromonas sp. CG_9.11]|uniref:porin n=1 Tax=Polaromonas sp. CG_9.11 TaxID=2787730 RepID=UPI0018CB520B|nr:porin [Polaromonas sp. CG_9.11]MBG6075270.1 putative porin [Polaromonas sp. CG_9.11]
MHQKIMALGAALLCTAGAHAQTAVQFTGIVDAYAGSLKMAGDASRQSVVNSGGLTTSWFGLKGSEDLGSGLKANFALTAFLRADTGAQGRFANDPLFSRDANVSLSGDFGTVLVGRWMAPNFLPSVVGNPLGDSFTFSPLILHMNVPLFNGTGWAATTPSDTGWSNQIAYTTPKFGGLQANFQYQFGELPGDNGKKNVGANFFYFGGPLTLTGFYERDQISNPGIPYAYLGTTKKDWMLLGAYDFGVVKPFASYGRSRADNSTNEAKTMQLGASIPAGPTGKVLVDMVNTKLSQTGVKRTTATLGYDYNLSKRTDAYAILMNDRITNKSTGNSVGVGIRHRF